MPNRDIMPSCINEHKTFIKPSKHITHLSVRRGDIVQFTYNGEIKTVLVVDPKWEGKLHGLSLNAVPRKLFVPLIDEAAKATSAKNFYYSKLKPNPIGPKHAYRTYDLKKMTNLKIVDYEI
jgi:hypothetical protein